MIEYDLLKQTISLEVFIGCIPQILLSPFLNTLSHADLVTTEQTVR